MMVHVKNIDFIQYIVVDLFCGAGGTTTGFEDAELTAQEIGLLTGQKDAAFKLSQVVACVNHDPIAIKSHWANHPDVYHFEEDITLLYGIIRSGILLRSPQFQRLVRLIDIYRAFYPGV